MENKFKKENSFLVSLGVCVVILLVICGISFEFSLRGTWGYFPGGTTGTLGGTIYKVIYNSNWPDENLEDEKIEDQKKNIYMIMDNMFVVPDGYEFVGWVDVNGNEYKSSDVIKLTVDLELYALWNKLDIEVDDTSVKYGDVNQNGEIDEGDYLIIEGYVAGLEDMDDMSLLNADVNVDGKIDLIDADIIKQVCLGNNLYMGKLPVEPILIYDIYEGNVNVGNNGGGSNEDGNDIDDSEVDSDDGNTGSSGSGNGVGTGNGQSGSGTGSSGNGGNNQGNSSSNGNLSGSMNENNNSNNDDNTMNNGNDDKDNNSDDDEVLEKRYYYSRFMNGNLEHRTTRCEVMDDDSCYLVLPDEPIRDGYIFNGWSIDKNCSNGSIINKSIGVNSDNTYYACYIIDSDNDNSNIYVIVMVIGIVLIAVRMIWYLVVRYREENKEIDF